MAIDDSYTKLLMHMNGADNGTTFADESGKIVTIVGNACTKTGAKKFGTASAFFDGNGDYISTPSDADFAFGTEDFTIDFWIYKPVAGTVDWQEIIETSQYNVSKGIVIQFMDSGRGMDKLSAIMGTIPDTWETYRMKSNTNIPIAQWVHIAVVRSGANAYLFQNGTLVGSMTNQSGISYTSSVPVIIGASTPPGNYFNGYLDEFRISKGIARWTANFTPPTAEYGADVPTGRARRFAQII